MKRFFKFFPHDNIILWGFTISLIVFIVCLIIVAVFYRFLPPFLPIYNKMPWGYARVGTKIEIFLPIAIGFSFYLINLFLSKFFYNKFILLGRFFSATTIAVSVITFIFILEIIILVK